MLKKTSYQNMILLMCTAIFVLLPSLTELIQPQSAQIAQADKVSIDPDQDDLDPTLLPAIGLGVFSLRPTPSPEAEITGYSHLAMGLQFARGPPLFS